MKMLSNISLAVLVVSGLFACSSTSKNESSTTDQKVAAEQPVETPAQMLERAATSFSNIEGLGDAEKAKLREVYTRTFSQSMEIRKELGQSKSLLFKTLAQKDYKNSEIKNLKSKIVALDQKRLNIMFKALDDVQAIVGKNTPAAEKLFEQFERYDYPVVRDQKL